jgi:hypothetical protein
VVDVEGVERVELELADDRQEVVERADWFEWQEFGVTETPADSGEEDSLLDELERDGLTLEVAGEGPITTTGPVWGVGKSGVGGEDLGRVVVAAH